MLDTRAGVCIIKENAVLLLQEKDHTKKGNWGPPGGHGELDETLEETAIRECREEAGLNIKIDSLIQAAILKRDSGVVFIAIFGATIIGDEKVTIQEEEVSDFVWATKEDIENDTYPLRNSLLKPVFLRAFEGKIAPVDTLIQLSRL